MLLYYVAKYQIFYPYTKFDDYDFCLRYWSKIADFNLPHLYLGPSLGGDPVEMSSVSLASESKSRGLSNGIVCVIQHLAILVQYQLMTDRQTDKQTDTRRQHVLC